MVEHVSQHLGKRMVPEGHPLGRCARGLIEVLMLAAVGLHRQDDQVPFLPIYLLPVHRSISFAFQDKQLDSPLMPVSPRIGFYVLNKTGPALRCRFQYCSVSHLMPVEEPLGIPLPPLAPREILGSYHDLAVLGVLPGRRVLPQRFSIMRPFFQLDRFSFSYPFSFQFGSPFVLLDPYLSWFGNPVHTHALDRFKWDQIIRPTVPAWEGLPPSKKHRTDKHSFYDHSKSSPSGS